VTETGVRNILKHFGILKGRLGTAAWRGEKRPRVLEALSYRHYAKATEGGIFEPFVDLAGRVGAGQPLGQIHALDGGRSPAVQRAPVDGIVFMRHAFGLIERRAVVAIVAHESRRW
jgi:predicted deacylase